MKHSMTPLCVICAVILCISCSASEPTTCPDTVDVQQHLTAAVDGWKSILDDTPHRLANVTFYDGPPEKRAALVNDQTTHAAGKETAKWQFRPRSGEQI